MVVVKTYIKRDPQEDLGAVDECLKRMAKALDTRSCPNVLPYQRWLQSNVSWITWLNGREELWESKIQ